MAEINLAGVLGGYLARVFQRAVEVLSVRPLFGDDGEDVKGFRYGVPLAVRCRVGDEARELVVAGRRRSSAF